MNQPPDPPLIDPGNPYLHQGQLPATFSIGHVDTPDGKKVVLTARSGGTTLTLMIDPANAIAVGQQLIKAGRNPPGLVIPARPVERANRHRRG